MSYQAQVYNVMIASPSDVAAERAAIRQTLADWNVMHSQTREIVLLPLGWETHSTPAMGHPPQAILNAQLLDLSDLLVGVFWTRLGTPTENHPSGSVEEIEEHIKADKPVMLYFSNEPVKLNSVDSDQYDALVSFKESCRDRGLFEEYEGPAQFREKFSRQLQIKLNDHSYLTAGRGGLTETVFVPVPSQPEPSLNGEAELLLAAATEADGTVLRLSHFGGVDVQAGKRNFVEGSDRREIARWEAAVDELERYGLIEDKKGKREVYFVTNEGFRVADSLPKAT